MRKSMKIIIVLAAFAVVLGIILFPAGLERGKLMRSKTTTVYPNGTVHLPSPKFESATSIEKALRERRSQREYRQGPLSLEEVAQLLWAAQGITHRWGFRTAPSAGALYPLETYLVAGEVRNLPSGVYRYLSHRHELALVLSGDMCSRLCSASLKQDPICTAPAAIVFSAVFARSTGKYGQRGIRYAHMEAGAAAQNVSLQAVSLNLGTVVIGAFDDQDVKRVLSMPDSEAPMIIMPVGREVGAESGT
jgi:SagB-type dehydrogenase family enzyme